MWEYLVEEMNISEKWRPKKQAEELMKFQTRLNELGREGWEMVNYQAIPMTGSYSGNVKGYAYLCFFKRPSG